MTQYYGMKSLDKAVEVRINPMINTRDAIKSLREIADRMEEFAIYEEQHVDIPYVEVSIEVIDGHPVVVRGEK